eukprot:20319-Heterococcus_DN1.PRE.2
MALAASIANDRQGPKLNSCYCRPSAPIAQLGCIDHNRKSTKRSDVSDVQRARCGFALSFLDVKPKPKIQQQAMQERRTAEGHETGSSRAGHIQRMGCIKHVRRFQHCCGLGELSLQFAGSRMRVQTSGARIDKMANIAADVAEPHQSLAFQRRSLSHRSGERKVMPPGFQLDTSTPATAASKEHAVFARYTFISIFCSCTKVATCVSELLLQAAEACLVALRSFKLVGYTCAPETDQRITITTLLPLLSTLA